MLKVTELFLDGGRVLGADERYAITDEAYPVLSWAVSASGGNNVQAAYRVRIGEDYDTGWVDSCRQSHRYDGKPLPSGVFLPVTVMLRDRYGEESEVFATEIVSGVLSEDARVGKWIGVDEPTDGRVLYFRKDIVLEEQPESACLYVCGLGYHDVTVDGENVSYEVLAPAHANYRKVTYYNVMPAFADHLHVGKNILGIEVAEGWRNNTSDFLKSVFPDREIEFMGPSQLWAMLVLRYEDGREEVIATDESWGVKLGGIVDASIYGGETYDAGVSDPAWNTAKEPSGFLPVTEKSAPGGEMRPMVLEPIEITETYPALDITMPKEGMFVVDFGTNIAGVAHLFLPQDMEKGQTVTLRFAEELNEDGTLFTEVLRDAKCTDTYIASGDERDLTSFLPKFTFHGFRYCAVTGLELLQIDQITALQINTNLKNRSFFRCGSALANEIQKMIVQTEEDNMHSILSDCPQRDERMGWMNDATVRFEETPYNFDIGRIFPKIVRDIRAEQRGEGQFTCCCPFYAGALPADPVCSSYLVAARGAWMHTGNRAILEEGFAGMAAWEDYLLSRSNDYIVDYSYYGDWAAPVYACLGGDMDAVLNLETEGILMSTGYSYFNCVTLARFASEIGKEDQAERYASLAEKVKEAFLARWYDRETGKVAKGSMGAQAFALWLGILPEEDEAKAAEVMVRDLRDRNYQFTTGNLNTKYLMDMLSKHGYVDDAWKLVQKESYPSLGYMYQNEATTVWERLELKKNPGMNSHNHPMYGAFGSFFYEYIAGITPTSPAYETVRIAPTIPQGLLSCQAVVDSVKGPISVRWNVKYGKKYLFLQIPFGVTASVSFEGVVKCLGSGYHVIETE